MSDLIENIKKKRDAILLGEIGALLHDIGKCHPDFIGTNSIENIPNRFKHTDINEFLDEKLVQLIKNDRFKIKINNDETDIYSLITKHHDRSNKNTIIKIVQSCDRLDSADDKGIVRKKQSKDKTFINSPFGYSKEKIDLQCLQKRLEDLQDNLKELFQNFVSETISLSCFRESLILNLKTVFPYALGETRIPANDVTLWDHSYSTASLFKSILCAVALKEDTDPNKLQWRILGFCWDGVGFIKKGRQIADILSRKQIIEDSKDELKKKFENEIPIGNAIYEDDNGIYFTFPALTGDKSKDLAKDLAETGLKIIREKSNDEIWPFFTLSKASRSLTILADELRFASQKRNLPKMAPALFLIEDNSPIFLGNPEMPQSQNGKDICPVCRLRTKQKNDEKCDVCKERGKGRLQSWVSNREDTIWLDEVADVNNCIALLSLSFDLSKWLDGTMIGTIFSQSFEDWVNSEDWKKFINNKQNIRKLEKKGINISDTLFNLSKNCLKIITDENISNDQGFKSDLINTFYEDVKSKQDPKEDEYVVDFINNIRTRLSPEPFTSSNLQKLIFTQNPSPARIYRIWREAEDFFESVISEIKSKMYSRKWKRIGFEVDTTNFQPEENTTYIIKKIELKPENLLVLHTSNGKFYTIESLEKYKFPEKSGVEAVKEALNKEINWIAKEDKPNENLLENGRYIKINNGKVEEDYYPFIEITRSPLLMRLFIPASDAIKVTSLIEKLYNKRFEKVRGKLPLSIGLLVSKKKFPIYVLQDAADRLFYDEDFRKPVMMDTWWNTEDARWNTEEISNDTYYAYYPTREPKENRKYTLDDLDPVSKKKPYALFPGYFDFDLLLGTADRYNITYKERKRSGKDYTLFTNRPYYFYQISLMMNLWKILKDSLANSQIKFIEEMLTSKLKEWKNVDDANKDDVFEKFAEAILEDAFGEKWEKLRIETRDFLKNAVLNGILLDTIILFKHIIKEKEDGENE